MSDINNGAFVYNIPYACILGYGRFRLLMFLRRYVLISGLFNTNEGMDMTTEMKVDYVAN